MWVYPESRYYETWYEQPPAERSDGEIKAEVVYRLRENPHTREHVLRVDVKDHVVILDGEVPTTLAKRAAGDDAWDTAGVADVSNLITVAGPEPSRTEADPWSRSVNVTAAST